VMRANREEHRAVNFVAHEPPSRSMACDGDLRKMIRKPRQADPGDEKAPGTSGRARRCSKPGPERERMGLQVATNSSRLPCDEDPSAAALRQLNYKYVGLVWEVDDAVGDGPHDAGYESGGAAAGVGVRLAGGF
jgi:hypothetical protein